MCRLIILLLFSFTVSASPVASLDKLGEGEMNYLFWTLYKAEYFSLRQVGGKELPQDSALRITYYKSISKQALLEATEDQWLKLGYTPLEVLVWLEPLKDIWTDVEPGDKLTFVASENGTGAFYFDNQLMGEISDTTFSDAFISIWLSSKTSQPRLRKQLLGMSE